MPLSQTAGRFLEAEFKKADHDRDGKISLQDFISYYEQIAYYQAQTSREGRIKSATYKHQVPVGECGERLGKRCSWYVPAELSVCGVLEALLPLHPFLSLCLSSGMRSNLAFVSLSLSEYRPVCPQGWRASQLSLLPLLPSLCCCVLIALCYVCPQVWRTIQL